MGNLRLLRPLKSSLWTLSFLAIEGKEGRPARESAAGHQRVYPGASFFSFEEGKGERISFTPSKVDRTKRICWFRL